MARPVRYRIIERNVQRLASPSGELGNLATQLARSGSTIAKRIAPKRSGTLRRGIQITKATTDGYLQVSSELRSTASHSLFVHEGTGPVISSDKVGFMLVPRRKMMGGGSANANRGSALFKAKKPVRRKQFVRGQRDNPFLTRAIDLAFTGDPRLITVQRVGRR